MKRLILLAGLLFAPVFAFAISPQVWKSSNTSTADGNKMLCEKRGVLHGVCTSFGVASSSTTLYNSSWTVVGVQRIAGPISTFVADQCKYYDTTFTNGLLYQKTNTATVTYLYDCY